MESFYDELLERGVSRREFLKYCGYVAALLGLSKSSALSIATKIAGAAESGLIPALWINGGACTGCTESIAQASGPNVADIVLDILSLNAVETISMATGVYAEDATEATYKAHYEGRPYILIYEGTVMTGLGGNVLRVADVPQTDHLEHLGSGAAAVIAMGTCAVDGGWVNAHPNPAGGTGVSNYLVSKGISTPVVNLPGCPINPLELVSVIVLALADDGSGLDLDAVVQSLDNYGRPRHLYSDTIHDRCPRRLFFEQGQFVYEFNSPEEAKGWCLYPLGCKGPRVHRHCPELLWNNRESFCIDSGAPCIGCASLNWLDASESLSGPYRRGIFGNNNPAMMAVAAGAGAAATLGAVGIGFGLGRMRSKKKQEQEEPRRDVTEALTKEGGVQ